MCEPRPAIHIGPLKAFYPTRTQNYCENLRVLIYFHVYERSLKLIIKSLSASAINTIYRINAAINYIHYAHKKAPFNKKWLRNVGITSFSPAKHLQPLIRPFGYKARAYIFQSITDSSLYDNNNASWHNTQVLMKAWRCFGFMRGVLQTDEHISGYRALLWEKQLTAVAGITGPTGSSAIFCWSWSEHKNHCTSVQGLSGNWPSSFFRR
jgi:hypothetical protein